MMKKMFAILLLAVMVCFANCYANDGDKYSDGTLRVTSTDEVILTGNSMKVPYAKKTAGATLATTDSGKTIVYRPATPGAAATFNLPSSAVGLEYKIVAGTLAAITINPADADVIQYLTLDAGDKIVSASATSDSVTLTCAEAGYWSVAERSGTWSDGGA